MKLSEKQIQNTILEYLKAKKILHWRQNTGSLNIDGRFIKFSEKGISDIIGCLPNGTFFAIEVKAKKRKPTIHQQNFLENVKKNKGLSLIAYDLNDVKKYI